MKAPCPLVPPEVIDIAAQIASAAIAELLGPSRLPCLVRPRWAVVLVARECGYSRPAIAAALNRDPSTLVTAERRATGMFKRDPDFARMCNALADRTTTILRRNIE